MDSTRRITVPGDAAGQRIDAHIAAQLPELSRSRVAQLMESGNVRLNGAVPRKSDRVTEGDLIELEVPPLESSVIEAEAIPLDIVYEDADLLVVNKPAGLVVHPAPGHRSGTLVNALLHHVRDLSGIGGVKRPGIVHRLDKDTSGLMIVAKHDRAHRRLSGALKRRDIHRGYLAASWGHLQQDRQTVDAPLARSRSDRKKIAIAPDGRRAVTHFTRVERWVAADLLEARLETGRTHQIRVHLAHLGHPVVGDEVYGGGGARGISGTGRVWARELEARVPRQFLHAARLGFEHPGTGERVELEAPLPPDLAGAAEWARSAETR